MSQSRTPNAHLRGTASYAGLTYRPATSRSLHARKYSRLWASVSYQEMNNLPVIKLINHDLHEDIGESDTVHATRFCDRDAKWRPDWTNFTTCLDLLPAVMSRFADGRSLTCDNCAGGSDHNHSIQYSATDHRVSHVYWLSAVFEPATRQPVHIFLLQVSCVPLLCDLCYRTIRKHTSCGVWSRCYCGWCCNSTATFA